METLRIINDEGYKALRRLAETNPAYFINPEDHHLDQLMVAEAGTDLLWGSTLDLHHNMTSLNEETKAGPGSDEIHARTIRNTLPSLTPATACNGYLWASINCFAIPQYIPIRWSTSNTKETRPSNFVLDHWIQYSGSDGRKWNAAARLWWMGELADRIAPYSEHTPDELLATMAGNVNFYHQTIDRTYLAANPKLLAVLYDVFLDGNGHLNVTKAASDMLKSLNLRAGANALDMMDYDDLRSIVDEAKPPKARMGHDSRSSPPALRVLSLGGGVQSTVMSLLAEEGSFGNKPDCAIFADTGWEPQSVYDNIDWLESQVSFPIMRVSNGRNLLQDVKNGVNAQGQPWLTLPVYLADGDGKSLGINWRQCTKNYKLDPIRRAVQELLGILPRQIVFPETNVEMWLGITTDEILRIKPSRNAWINHRYPLVSDLPMNRNQCRDWFADRYPDRKLMRSACIGCPFRSSSSWLEVQENEPEQFEEAVQLDRMLRSPDHNAGRMFRKQAYLHHRRVPLADAVALDYEQRIDVNQFINECEGHCGL